MVPSLAVGGEWKAGYSEGSFPSTLFVRVRSGMIPAPRLRFAWLPLLLLGCGALFAQTKPSETPKASAFKFPDGTVVFFTKNPDEANPVVDGVLLSAAEYKDYLDQLEQLKKAKEATKPIAPSSVELKGKIEARGERNIAAITATFSFRTTAPKSLVSLGCQRAAVVAARGPNGKMPILSAEADGLTVAIEAAGDYTLSLDLEVPVSPRSTKGEFGFEFGLPRAAVSTFKLEKVLAENVKSLSIGTRSTEPNAVLKRTAASVSSLTEKAWPLGPTDVFDATWDPTPAATATDAMRSVETDVAIRFDETQIETVAKFKLTGPSKEWALQLPAGGELAVERVGVSIVPLTSPTASVVKPSDPNKPIWIVRIPLDSSPTEWLATFTTSQQRPKLGDPKARGPFPLGPFVVGDAKQSGKVSVSAAPGLRLAFKPTAELRRGDLPALAADDLIALFAFSGTAKRQPWLEVEVRPSSNLARVRPQHKLKYAAGAWRLETVVRVTPAPRTEVEQLTILWPTGWSGLEFGPVDLVEPTGEGKDEAGGKMMTLRFVTPQKTPFEFTVVAFHSVEAMAKSASLLLPRFPTAEESETKLSAQVPEGFELAAKAFRWQNNQIAPNGESVPTLGRSPPAMLVGGDYERGLGKVDVAWQPYRPELNCEVRAEVTVQERQLAIQQTFKFQVPEGDLRPIRFRGPPDALGFRSTPRLESVGMDLWEFVPVANEAKKEVSLTVQYALRPARFGDSISVPFLWPEAATRLESTVRVWGAGRRVEKIVGRWRELPPELNPERDSFPAFTLAANGPEPLELQFGSGVGNPGAAVVVERALVQVGLGEDGTASYRTRYRLKRWPAGGIGVRMANGTPAEFSVNGQRIEATPTAEGWRVPAPEAAGDSGVCLLEMLATGSPTGSGRIGRLLTAPSVVDAVYSQPIRWYIAAPEGRLPLQLQTDSTCELAWNWNGRGFSPIAAETSPELEKWWREGRSSDSDSVAPVESLLLTQSALLPVNLALVPSGPWIAAVSFLAFLLVLGIQRLRWAWRGPLLAASMVGGVVGALVWPQLSAQVLAAAQYGIAFGLVVLGILELRKWLARRRIERLPTFSRLRPPSNPEIPLGSRPSRAAEPPALAGS